MRYGSDNSRIETQNVETMKNLPYIIIVCLCVLAVIPSRCFDHRDMADDIRRDTVEVIRIDTFRDTLPIPVYEKIIDSFPVRVPVPVSVPGDTVRDTVAIYLPITQKVYHDSLYTAYVSGYRAKLDSIEVYGRTRDITIRETPRRKRWGLGVQVGYGMAGNKASPFVGLGVSYNLFEW